MDQKNLLSSVMKILLIINVGVFVLDLITEGEIINRYGGLSLPEIKNLQLWRFVSYFFIHSQNGFTHILFNMLMLWMFGNSVVLSLGEKSFLRFYFMSGIFAGVVTMLFDVYTGVPKIYIGSSGAVLSVVVFFGCYSPNQKLWIWGIFPLKAKWMVVLIVLGDILFFGDNNIASISHLAGAFFGFAYYYVFFKRSLSKWKQKLKQYQVENQENQELILNQSDAILKKISEHGLNSLTAKEKLILKQSSEIRKINEKNKIGKRKNFYGE